MANPKGKSFKRKGRQKNRTSKDESKSRRYDEEGQLNTARNDISWYSKYPELLAAAGQLPYPWRPGMVMPLGTLTESNMPVNYLIPGVMSFDWVPSVGYSDDVTSPISIAAKEIYARVRSAFSGSLEADPPDFIMYLMALDSIYSYIASLKRIYRITNSYTPQNVTIPEGLLIGILDYVSTSGNPQATYYDTVLSKLQAGKMKLYGAINELIHMVEKFRCPAIMDIFNRHYWLNDNVYADANTANSQLYMFVQRAYLKFALIKTPQGVDAGGLTYVQAPAFVSSLDPVDELFNYGKRMIDALAKSDDAYTISGYLMRAFEGVPTFTVDLLQYDERLELKYDEEVLTQIENLMSLPDFDEAYTTLSDGKWDISQNPTNNVILSTPKVTYTASTISTWFGNDFWKMKMLNNIRSDMPTVADSVIATRLKSWLEPDPTDDMTFIVHAATECVIGVWINTFTNQGWDHQRVKQHIYAPNTAAVSSLGNMLYAVPSFDWAPLIYVVRVNTSGATPVLVGAHLVWDVHNVTLLDSTNLEQLNRVCLYSELNAFNV